MSEDFNPKKFRIKRNKVREEREASAAARILPPAVLLSVLIAVCIGIYEHIT